MRACENDVHDEPERLGSEARIEGCSASHVPIRAIYVWYRVRAGGVPKTAPWVYQGHVHLYLSLRCGYLHIHGIPAAIYVKEGRTGATPHLCDINGAGWVSAVPAPVPLTGGRSRLKYPCGKAERKAPELA